MTGQWSEKKTWASDPIRWTLCLSRKGILNPVVYNKEIVGR